MTGRRKLIAWLSALSLVALVLANIAVFGGFDERTDVFLTADLNEPIDIGPATFWVESATASKTSRDWQVDVNTRCQLNLQDSIPGGGLAFAMTSGSGTVELGDRSVQPVVVGKSPSLRVGVGADTKPATNAKRDLSPGLGTQDCQFSFDMPESWDPSSEVRFVLHELVYADRSYVNNGTSSDKSWLRGQRIYRIDVPLTVKKR